MYNLIHQWSSDLKLFSRLDGILNGLRRIDEGHTQTLDRLIEERRLVVELLSTNGYKSQPFDYEFKYDMTTNLKQMIEERKERDQNE